MQYVETVEYKTSARVKARVETIYYYPFHLHESSMEIICVLHGEVMICDAAARYTLRSGDVYIFNPRDPHRIQSKVPGSLLLTLQLDLSHYEKSMHELKDGYFLCDTRSSRDLWGTELRLLRFYLARLYGQYTERSSDLALEECARQMLQLLLTHFRQYTYRAEEKNPAAIVLRQNQKEFYRDYERMYRIVDYVEDHFREPLRLTTLADMEYLSSAHLSRYLKNTLGLSFSSFLSLIRCEEAARQLSSSRKTVDQIASEVGFSNRKHLAVQFRKWYRQTPSDYRNAILQDLHCSAETERIAPEDPRVSAVIERYLEEC